MSFISIGVIVALIAYGIVISVLSKKGAQKTSGNAAEFFVAGRSASPIVLLGTLCLTIWSALSFYGWPAAGYRTGLGYYSGATGTFFMGLLGPCIMYPMWLLGKKYGYMTPISVIKHRYDSRSLSLLFAFICIFFMIPYIATQIIAVANGITVTTEGQIAYWICVAIITIYIFGHVVGGGANSVVTADTFAGFVGIAIVMISTVVISVNVFKGTGTSGLTEAVQNIYAANPTYLSHTGNYSNWFSNLGLTISAGAGLIVWPHVLVRSFMGKGPEVFKLQAVAQPLIVCVMFTMFIYQGVILGTTAFPGLDAVASDNIIPMLAVSYAPPIVCVLLVVGVFAFGLSTADSQVVVISSIVQCDIYDESSEKTNNQRLYLWLGILMVGVLLIVAFRPALLVTYAYSFSSPGFFQMAPAIIGGMFWKKATKQGAIVGTVAGLIGVLASLFVYNPIPSMNPVLWGIIFNLPLFIIVSLATKSDEKRTEEVVGFLSDNFRERNNGTFKLLVIAGCLVAIQDVCSCYMPNPLVFGFVPFQLFNHWCVAVECSVLGYLLCKNRFGEIKKRA